MFITNQKVHYVNVYTRKDNFFGAPLLIFYENGTEIFSFGKAKLRYILEHKEFLIDFFRKTSYFRKDLGRRKWLSLSVQYFNCILRAEREVNQFLDEGESCGVLNFFFQLPEQKVKVIDLEREQLSKQISLQIWSRESLC